MVKGETKIPNGPLPKNEQGINLDLPKNIGWV